MSVFRLGLVAIIWSCQKSPLRGIVRCNFGSGSGSEPWCIKLMLFPLTKPKPVALFFCLLSLWFVRFIWISLIVNILFLLKWLYMVFEDNKIILLALEAGFVIGLFWHVWCLGDTARFASFDFCVMLYLW